MPLLPADWWRGPFVRLGPHESTQAFGDRMRERERRVPFRRWRPVWQVQVSDVSTKNLLAYSTLLRRHTAIKKAKELRGVTRFRVVDVGTGEVVYSRGY